MPTACGSGTRFIATPEARSAPGYKDALLRTAEDGTVISVRSPARRCAPSPTTPTRHFEAHPEELVPFPEMLMKSMSGGWMHLGAHEGTEGVDPDRECYPAGQGVGAIDALEPAGDVVRRIVAEAETALDRLTTLR